MKRKFEFSWQCLLAVIVILLLFFWVARDTYIAIATAPQASLEAPTPTPWVYRDFPNFTFGSNANNGFYEIDGEWKVSGSVENLQRFLKATGNPRYDPGPIDNDPGPKFRKAYTNYCNDQRASRMFKKMKGEIE